MKKVLFLMVLLLLMGLGAAGVKAQVRIGGNTAPSAAAVLDLNATDAANIATGGLVLPRVDLKTNVMQLTSGVANQTGTMVYNVTTTLGRIGVYYWNGNSWVLASLPSTSSSDSGYFLMSTGSGSTWRPIGSIGSTSTATFTGWNALTNFAYLDYTLPTLRVPSYTWVEVAATGVLPTDMCLHTGGGDYMYIQAWVNGFHIINLKDSPIDIVSIRCYRLN